MLPFRLRAFVTGYDKREDKTKENSTSVSSAKLDEMQEQLCKVPKLFEDKDLVDRLDEQIDKIKGMNKTNSSNGTNGTDDDDDTDHDQI